MLGPHSVANLRGTQVADLDIKACCQPHGGSHVGAGRVDPGTFGSGINALADLACAALAVVAHCITEAVFKFSAL